MECIGRIGHDFERAFEIGSGPPQPLQLLGWIVIEVTWRRFVNAPETVIEEVRRALSGERLEERCCGSRNEAGPQPAFLIPGHGIGERR